MAPEWLLDGKVPGPACDVYAFGFILWYFLTEEKPYSSLTSLKQLKEHVSKGERPTIPVNTPKTLVDLIVRCMQQDPSKRPTLQTILNEKPWDTIVKEAIFMGDKAINEMWQRCGTVGEIPQQVKWDVFAPAFCSHLGIQVKKAELRDDIKFKALRAVLLPQKTEFVSLINFQKFLKWFGPVRVDEGMSFLQTIVDLLHHEWFHGDISAEEAANRINTSKNKNSFIVRFSQNSLCFTLSIKKLNEVEHRRIPSEFNYNLATYVKMEMEEKKMVACNVNYPFASLFLDTSKTEMRGYRATTATTTTPTANKEDDDFVGRQRSLDTTYTNLGTSAHFVQ